MTEPRLEEQLRGLADHLDAPASTTARQAIGHRSRVLRRRRRTRNTVLGVAVVAVVVGTASVLSRGADVETGPASTGGYRLPAITVDLDGWDVTSADEAPGEVDVPDGAYQVFRRPGADLVGPTVFVQNQTVGDTPVAMEGQQEVEVGDRPGVLTERGRSIQLDWNTASGDSGATLHAWDLGRDEVLAFAGAMRVRDDEIQFPGSPDDVHGFDVAPAALPDGLEEVRIAPPSSHPPTVRSVELRNRPASVRLEVADRGQLAFEATLNSLLGYQEGVESATVLERPAILYPMGADQWLAHVRLDDRSTLLVTATGVDRAEFDDLLEHLEEVDEKDWLDLLAEG